MKKFLWIILFLASPALGAVPAQLCSNVTANGLTTCQPISSSNPLPISIGSSGIAFSSIASGTNTMAAMVVGAGASMSFAPAANTGNFTITGGIDTANNTLFSFNPTWNNAAITYDAPFLITLTNTASNSSSNVLDIKNGVTSIFAVRGNNGSVVITGNFQTNASVSTGTSGVVLTGANGAINFNNAAYLGSSGANTFRIGQTDAAAPSTQTLGVQNVVTATSNTAGANFTINGSRGTGTGAGGTIILQTAPATTTGSTPNALVTQLTVNNTAGISTQGIISNGTKFTTSGAGCTVTGTTGGATAGSITTSTTGTCTVIVTLNGATGFTAPNGWACHGSNITSGAAAAQTATSATSCTIKVATSASDIIIFSAMAY